ncbi:seleno O [Micractinium conductrix]|uniref:Selenoprotein O n=1 Tax=Micractinium conductrix TaxID=554055 RepID=A0A2P6V500_9CHLO|nr:seleno O [Micractinium conductrix]|eukprot:PSC69159.1 seleno O [Micractinium conductrix]
MGKRATSWRLLLLLALLASAPGALAGDAAEATPPHAPDKLWKCLANVKALRVVTRTTSPAEYAAAAEGWNRLYSSSPLAVLFPRKERAVAAAVRCARAAGVRIVPRCGGSSFMGYSERDGMLTMDLTEMNGVKVARDRKTVTVGGGARLGEVYYKVWKQAGDRLTIVAGTCPSVGAGGHILGGGMGWLSLQHGMACDQLVSLRMVTAGGKAVVAHKKRNPDLFAASCGGGGGNFGIVTEMKLKLVPVAPLYTQASVEIGADKAAAWLEHYDSKLNDLAHPALFMEPRLDKLKVKVGLHWPGDTASLEAELRRVALLGPGSFWTSATAMTSPREGTWADSLLSFAGAQAQGTLESLTNFTYMRTKRDAAGFKELSWCPLQPTNSSSWQRVLNALNETGNSMKWKRAGPKSAVGRVDPGATAFPWRKALWCSQLASRWKSASDVAAGLAGLQRATEVFNPIFGQTAYINYLEGSIPIEAYYGPNLAWLKTVKRRGSCRAAVLRVALAYALLPLATTGSPLAAAASASPRLQSLLPPRAPGRPAECVMPFSASLLGRALSASAGTARRATAAARRVNRGTSTAPWVTPALRDGTCRAAAGMSSSAGSAPVAAAAAEAAPILDGGAAAPSSNGGSAASAQGLRSLEDLPFDNTFTAELPGDISESNLPRQVHSSFYSWVTPSPTGTEPTTIAASADVARLVGLDPEEAKRPEFALIFSGNAPLPQTRSYSQCYGGHQFGHWAGQLGDGRAICLGQAVNAEGERWELQLKGAGRTPFSRMADGRAVLRSSIREYIASEAMHAMGVPTTRALSLVATGDQVMRDMFYNGNAQFEPGAVVCRVSRSFVRFGTFQLPVTRPADKGMVKILADYVIRHHFQHLAGEDNKYGAFLKEVSERTAHLVAEWHRVGFVHGVLNTDNMSVLGETIDYGPYGFMERFDPDFTPNTTDIPGRRYCFRDQPEIGQWNVLQLAKALVVAGVITEDEAAAALQAYADVITVEYQGGIAAKLGLKRYDADVARSIMRIMYDDSADFTNTFRSLSSVRAAGGEEMDGASGLPAALAAALGPLEEERYAAWRDWLQLYRGALLAQGMPDAERAAMQDAVNPAVIPRNHVMGDIIGDAEQGNYESLHRYMAALLRPYEADGLDPAWLEPAPKECRVGVELLSCSS